MADNTATDAKELPDVHDFAFLHPLYSLIKTDDYFVLSRIRGRSNYKFDMFCVGCGRDATFSVYTASPNPIVENMRADAEWQLEAKCTRKGHQYWAYFVRREGSVLKVGQYPSVADIDGADIRKYRAVLRDGYFPELVRAVGLSSHGIGIGAFVYLRRIFEKLIWDHYETRKVSQGDIEGFPAMRMNDKVAALRGELPQALVDNAPVYSILSKGIHELTEEECKLYFPVLRAAIINILEEDFQARERQAASKRVADEIAKISSSLGPKSSAGKDSVPSLADLARDAGPKG